MTLTWLPEEVPGAGESLEQAALGAGGEVERQVLPRRLDLQRARVASAELACKSIV